MKPHKSSRAIFGKKTTTPHVKFHNGMFVRYTGRQASLESRRHMATTPIVLGATYTVAQSVVDGAHVWLFVQELPGVRFYADGFVPIPHQAEDHWQLAEVPVQAQA
jgi:hypothetical protein